MQLLLHIWIVVTFLVLWVRKTDWILVLFFVDPESMLTVFYWYIKYCFCFFCRRWEYGDWFFLLVSVSSIQLICHHFSRGSQRPNRKVGKFNWVMLRELWFLKLSGERFMNISWPKEGLYCRIGRMFVKWIWANYTAGFINNCVRSSLD